MMRPVKSDNVEIWHEADTGFICARIAGRMEKEDAVLLVGTITSFLTDVLGPRKPYYVLIDIRHATGVSPEARKFFGDAPKASAAARELELGQRAAIFGGSFAFRTLANLIMRALSVAKALTAKGDERLEAKWTMEADEGAARAWLTEQRRADRARAESP